MTLDCTVTGIPEPQTTWHKDHRVIVLSENPHIHILNNGQALQITNAETEDTGLYLCHAENDAGIAKKSYDVEVQGKYEQCFIEQFFCELLLMIQNVEMKDKYSETCLNWPLKNIQNEGLKSMW